MARTSEGMQVIRLRMTVWWPLIFLALMQVPEHTNGQSKYIVVTLLASMCSSVEAFLTHIALHVDCLSCLFLLTLYVMEMGE